MTTLPRIDITERAELLPLTTLKAGSHRSPSAGVCLLEAVAYIAGEPHTDTPECACPILGSFGRSLNDVLPDDKRQRLVPLAPAIVGTAGDGLQQERGLMAADWLIRVYTPTWLRLAGLESEALSLETLPRQATWDDVEAATPALVNARKAAYAAGAAARAAAWAAAWAAAGAAAWAAAGAAAWAALQPTVDTLQDSAIDLFGRMVHLGDAR